MLCLSDEEAKRGITQIVNGPYPDRHLRSIHDSYYQRNLNLGRMRWFYDLCQIPILGWFVLFFRPLFRL